MVSNATLTKAPSSLKPRVLVVDDEPSLHELVGEMVSKEVDCWLITAHNVGEARQILATQPIELLVTDVHLPDGDGMSLLPALRRHQPCASAIVITGDPSVDGAISALRNGALDFVPKPFTVGQLTDRMKKALERQQIIAKTEKRLGRLREAVRRLNEARKLVSKKVDVLCNDLVSAYGELARQLDTVRTQEGFRKFLSEAKDLEQLLCHMMDWILRQLGYCNVAIWLASDDHEFELGAYMKYKIAGDKELTTAMKQGVVALAAKEAFVHLQGDDVQDRLTPAELDYLADQEILAINCTYLAEPLAVVALFRDADEAFTDADVEILKAISPLIASALASIVRGSAGADGDDEFDAPDHDGFTPDAADEDGDSGGGGGAGKSKRSRSRKPDPADWWKRGETPPF